MNVAKGSLNRTLCIMKLAAFYLYKIVTILPMMHFNNALISVSHGKQTPGSVIPDALCVI